MMPAASASLTGPIQGLQTNLFEGIQAPQPTNGNNTISGDTNASTNEPAPQATFQAISVPVNSSGGSAPAMGSMQLGKKINPMQAAAANPTGGITFARKQDNGQVKQLGAKKLDIDFGGDDFFNSFQPAAAQEPDQPLFGAFGSQSNSNAVPKKSNKLQEIDSDPFKLGPSAAGSSSLSSNPLGGVDTSNSMSD